MPDRNHYAGVPGDLILHENRNYLNHTVNMDSGVLASGVREGVTGCFPRDKSLQSGVQGTHNWWGDTGMQ